MFEEIVVVGGSMAVEVRADVTGLGSVCVLLCRFGVVDSDLSALLFARLRGSG